MSVPDEGYSSNVPDEGYSRNVPDEGYSGNVPDEGYSSNVPDEGYSRNASCALNVISTFLFKRLKTQIIIHLLGARKLNGLNTITTISKSAHVTYA